MMKVRRPTYERVASVRVDTAGRTPEEIVDAVVAELKAARA
jgi:shikimate kinase